MNMYQIRWILKSKYVPFNLNFISQVIIQALLLPPPDMNKLSVWDVDDAAKMESDEFKKYQDNKEDSNHTTLGGCFEDVSLDLDGSSLSSSMKKQKTIDHTTMTGSPDKLLDGTEDHFGLIFDVSPPSTVFESSKMIEGTCMTDEISSFAACSFKNWASAMFIIAKSQHESTIACINGVTENKTHSSVIPASPASRYSLPNSTKYTTRERFTATWRLLQN